MWPIEGTRGRYGSDIHPCISLTFLTIGPLGLSGHMTSTSGFIASPIGSHN